MKKFENLGRMLSKEEQRHILGGNPPGGGVTCKTKCFKWNGSEMDEGTCSKKTQTIGDKTLEYCDCSLSGGTDCNE